MPSIIQQKFPILGEYRIVVSENVYTKLAKCIKLCSLSMGKENNEFGTILYGYFKPNNVIYFEECSSSDDYIPKAGAFRASPNMEEELVLTLVNSSKYNCVSHVHTHPFINNECNRFLSQEDVDYYKNTFNFNKEINGRKKYSFGTLLTIDKENNPKNYDISFVYYDPISKQMYHIPDISVIINNHEIPLEQIHSEFCLDEHSVVEFNRTKFDISEDRTR